MSWGSDNLSAGVYASRIGMMAWALDMFAGQWNRRRSNNLNGAQNNQFCPVAIYRSVCVTSLRQYQLKLQPDVGEYNHQTKHVPCTRGNMDNFVPLLCVFIALPSFAFSKLSLFDPHCSSF